jgi:hypothetical protein
VEGELVHRLKGCETLVSDKSIEEGKLANSPESVQESWQSMIKALLLKGSLKQFGLPSFFDGIYDIQFDLW